ncbi:MAG: DUF6790 family protein [Pseudomonadota bacterium]
MYTVYLVLIAVIIAVGQIAIHHAPVAETLLLWLLVIKIGLGGLWAFMGHYFKPDDIARYIGWPAGNPFQKEVAFTNLALGTCGLLCFFFRDGFWLATIVFASVFLLGAFSVHLKDQKESGNKNPGNAGPVFFADILVPLALWGLYFAR